MASYPRKLEIQNRRDRQPWRLLPVSLVALLVGLLLLPSLGQTQDQTMNVTERDESGRAKRVDINIVGMELPNLIRWLSKETGLSIVANQQDIEGKKFSLTNLKDVTVDEILEHVKTVLMQYNLTTIRTNKTLLITTMEKAVRMKVPVYVLEDVQKFREITPSDQIVTQIIMLQNAQATEMVNNLKPLLGQNANVFADASSNAVVITDVASNIQRVALILKVADQSPTTDLKLKIYRLENAQARNLARTLEDLFREEAELSQIVSKGARKRDPNILKKAAEAGKGLGLDWITGRIEIAADEDTNTLIVKASEDALLFMDTLIEQLDTSSFIQPEIKIFSLDYAIAEDVASELEQLIQGGARRPGRNAPWWERERYERERRRRKEEGQSVGNSIIGEVNITSDQRLNAIIVSSDPRNFPIIEKIIKELDQADPKEEIQMFYLKYADAETVVQNLQDLFEGGSIGNLPSWMRFERRMRNSERGGGQAAGIQGQVNMVADTRLNAVLVSTASVNISSVSELIKKLDESKPEQEWSTQIRTLQYADAENIADLINNIFQGSSGNQGFFFFIPRFNQRNQTQGSLAGNVRAEAYPTLNALILSASTARNFELLNQFIDSVDIPTPEGQREITRSIRLEYANASELASLLADVWEGESQGGGFSFRRFFERGGVPEQKDINSLRGKVTIFADDQTNSLIITTQERYWPEAEALIKELDVVRGQVWMDIEILEVTLDDDTRFGIETTVQEKGLAGITHRANNPLIGSIASQLGLGQEASGFNYTLATKEYMALIHALRSENKVRTLSTPSFLTRDNQPARFSRGKRVPFLQSAQSSIDTQRQIFDYAYLDNPVGVTIDVTPHIARSVVRDGGDSRTIGLDISQITISNLIEFTSFNAPITEDSEISAYIDVRDGDTILIGGMMRENQQEVTEQVPILGSIPIIGRLFKDTQTISEVTEIVIAITPHIVDIKRQSQEQEGEAARPDDLERLKQESSSYQDQLRRIRDFKEGKIQ